VTEEIQFIEYAKLQREFNAEGRRFATREGALEEWLDSFGPARLFSADRVAGSAGREMLRMAAPVDPDDRSVIAIEYSFESGSRFCVFSLGNGQAQQLFHKKLKRFEIADFRASIRKPIQSL
jgi:hypothetical protein